jgi:protein SCO1/2
MPPIRRLLLIAASLSGTLAGCDRAAAPPSPRPASSPAPAPAPAPATRGFASVDLTGAEYAHGFQLPDFDSKPRTLADFKGKVTAVFFGYTQCPDACPTTMAALAGVAKALGPDASRLQVVFITLDPARDTPALLKAYVTNFRPDFLALRGDDAQTREVAREFKVFYERVPGKTPETYTLDHTAGTYVFDPKGRIRLFARQNMDPAQLAGDIRKLLAEPTGA